MYYKKSSLLLLFATIVLFSQREQEKKLDSLYVIIAHTQVDSIKSNTYSELSLAYSGIDSLKTIQFAKKALQLAQRSKSDYSLSKSYFALGGLHLDYDQPKKAQAYYTQSKELLEKLLAQDSSAVFLKLWVRSTFNIGVSLSYQGRYEEEMEYAQKIIPAAEKLQFNRILARVNSNLAITFLNLGQYEKSHTYFTKSGPYYLAIKDYRTFAHDRLIFATCLKVMDSLKAMNTTLNMAKTYLDRTPNAAEWQLYYMVNGTYHTKTANYKEALLNFDKSYDLIQDSKVFGSLDQLYLNYFELYKALNNDKKAKEYLLLYYGRAQKNDNSIREVDVLKELAKYEQKDGNFRKANQYLLQLIKKEDSVSANEVLQKINQLEIQYQTEKKERKILELKNENSEAALTLEQHKSQRYFLFFTIGSLLSILILGYIIYRNRRRTSQLKANEYNQEIQTLKHEQSSKIYAAMLDGQENERKRLAADLHDGLAGRLSATSIQLNQLSKYSNTGEPLMIEITNAAKSIDSSLSELRNIARNIMPETLFKYGLKASIEDYCLGLKNLKPDTNFVLQLYDIERNIPDTTLLMLYRIIQELINNAIRHSKANEIFVQCMVEGNIVSITIEDNGIGFTKNTFENHKGIGIHNIEARVAYLNGSVEFDTKPNEGTNVHIEIEI